MMRKILLTLCLIAVAAGRADPADASESARLAGLKELSLDQLVNLEVSTVSRKEERWWTAPSGVDVVTGEEIRRAGVLNLPDALRLATGVQVGQPSERSWAVSLRGMDVLAANKISVVMDGRSLFTPFFSGVQWDVQDTLLEDVDRIEVVRGPVGSLWGSFAVNGFIQILTKAAWDTQGWLASAGTGTEDPEFFSVRYGGRWGEQTYYRVYAKYEQFDWTYDASGKRTEDPTDFFQTGFRVDALRAEDVTLTLQGDYYTNQDLPLDRFQTETNGYNLLGRWRRTYSPDSSFEVQAYFDHTYRLIPLQFEEKRNTLSTSWKFRDVVGRQDLLVGLDAFLSWDRIGNFGIAQLIPDQDTTGDAGVYVQDTIGLVPKTSALTLGVKVDQNSYSGFEYQPTIRYAWTPNPQMTAWSAISRAVRTPVRVDEALVIRYAGTTLFQASGNFQTERAYVYELGFRHQPSDTLTYDASVFHYDYDNIRSTEPAGAAALPLTFANKLNAQSWGGELTVMYQPAAWLFFKGSYRYLDLDFTRDPGSIDTTRGSSEGNDAKHVGVLGAHLTLPASWEFDAYLRRVSALPNPVLPGYTELELHLGWHPSPQWELALVGQNLLHRQHADFITTNSLNEQVHRSLTMKVTCRY